MPIKIVNICELFEELSKIGVDERAFPIFSEKANLLLLKIYDIDSRAATILKQEFLSTGGDVAVHKDVIKFERDTTSALLIGSMRTYNEVLRKLEYQPFFGLDSIRNELKEAILTLKEESTQKNIYKIPKIMGILNVSPDSFYGGSALLDESSAITRAEEMIKEGADILDIGGESTRPGSLPLTEEEELNRVIPVISSIRKRFKDIPISVDTYKVKVAKEAIEAGATTLNIINLTEEMIEFLSDTGHPFIFMHMRGTPKDMQNYTDYNDVVKEILFYFEEKINYLEKRGIKRERIIIDPGIGFAKTAKQNFEILRSLKAFKIFGLPLLIGHSRKSFLGKVLNGLSPEERLPGTLAVTAYAAMNGADIIRVHDVKENIEVLKVIKEIHLCQELI